MDHPRAATLNSELDAQRPTLERLFDAASSLFWEKGYAAASTREIAAAVGIQQASLYYHITSKEDLLYQLCVSSLQQLWTEVQSALAGVAHPLDRIRVLAHAHMATLLKYQQRHVTMLTELRALSPSHREEVVALRDRYAGLVRTLLEDAQAAGVVRADIPAQYLNLALLNILNWAVVWFRRNHALSAEQLAGLFVSVYLDGAGVAPARASLALPDLRVPRRPPLKNRKYRRAAPGPTGERLLDAAAELFARKGYAATSTREIAALVGIQKASLYYHIGSKEDLLYAICQSSLEQIRDDVERAVSKVGDPLAKVATMVGAHLESMLRAQHRHTAALAEMHALSPARLAQVRELRDSYEDVVRSVLKQGQDAGVLRSDIPLKYLCLSLLGLLNRVEVWFRREGALSPEQLGQVMAAIFLTGAAGQSAGTS